MCVCGFVIVELLSSLTIFDSAKALASSPSLENPTTGVVLVWSVAFVCTSCANGLVFPHSKVENMLISCVSNALGITLFIDIMPLELNVSSTKLGILHMEAMFLESPPLGLKILVPMGEVGFGASSEIGSPCQDNECTTLYSIGL